MNQNPIQVQLDGGASAYRQVPQTHFHKLTKTQLIQKLEYAEFMMSHLRDIYLKYTAKPEPFLFAHDRERGFASAMTMALGFITEEPDQTKVGQE